MPWVWECHAHGPQAVSFGKEPNMLALVHAGEEPICLTGGCRSLLGYRFQE